MRIGIGSDRSGNEFKEALRTRFRAQNHTIEDVCTSGFDPDSYHTATHRLASSIGCGRVERAVLVCSGAIGASIAANKYARVRAAFCNEVCSARRGVQDDNMNFLILEAQVVTRELARKLGDAFIKASYAPPDNPFGIHPLRLAPVVERIRKNLDKPLEVSDLAGLAEMSRSQFSKLFKQSTDLTPHQYILLERINRSKELLRQGNTKIVDIALEVGFRSQGHFTTVFGSVVGMTPRQFRILCGCGIRAAYPRNTTNSPLSEKPIPHLPLWKMRIYRG